MDMEEVQTELTRFSNQKDALTITPLLEEYLAFVAKTGFTYFPWVKIKPLFKAKLENVVAEFAQHAEEIPVVPNVDQFSFSACRDTVFEQLESFNGIPFTVQRLCELLTEPRKHYKRTDKFMRALEKNMLIVTSIHPKPVPKTSDETSIMNGDHSPHSSLSEPEEGGEPEKKSSTSTSMIFAESAKHDMEMDDGEKSKENTAFNGSTLTVQETHSEIVESNPVLEFPDRECGESQPKRMRLDLDETPTDENKITVTESCVEMEQEVPEGLKKENEKEPVEQHTEVANSSNDSNQLSEREITDEPLQQTDELTEISAQNGEEKEAMSSPNSRMDVESSVNNTSEQEEEKVVESGFEESSEAKASVPDKEEISQSEDLEEEDPKAPLPSPAISKNDKDADGKISSNVAEEVSEKLSHISDCESTTVEKTDETPGAAPTEQQQEHSQSN